VVGLLEYFSRLGSLEGWGGVCASRNAQGKRRGEQRDGDKLGEDQDGIGQVRLFD
jgi:hypothetical protein